MIRSFPTTLMQNPVFRLRTPDSRLLMFTLWMHPSNHLCGLFVLDLDHMALDVRLPLERTTAALAELITHQLVMRHAPLDQLWLPHMSGLLGNLGNEAAPVHKAVSKYVHGLVPSTLCHRVLDSLSIPYRHGSDFPDLCAWLPDDGAHVAQHTQSDTLPNRVPDRVLSVSVSGLGSDSGIGSDINPKTPATHVVSEGQQGSLPGLPPKQHDTKPAKTTKERKPKEPKPPKEPAAPTPGSIVYAAYREAFVRRYGVEPPWDNRTKTHFKRIATNTLTGRPPSCSDKNALAEACAVAARYVRHPDAHYTKQQHPPGLLDRDWHKLVTEYRTGRTVTGTHARDSERMESNPILEYAAEVRAMEEAQRRRKAEVVDVEQ